LIFVFRIETCQRREMAASRVAEGRDTVGVEVEFFRVGADESQRFPHVLLLSGELPLGSQAVGDVHDEIAAHRQTPGDADHVTASLFLVPSSAVDEQYSRGDFLGSR
jgi:hypothetical protein